MQLHNTAEYPHSNTCGLVDSYDVHQYQLLPQALTTSEHCLMPSSAGTRKLGKPAGGLQVALFPVVSKQTTKDKQIGHSANVCPYIPNIYTHIYLGCWQPKNQPDNKAKIMW